MKKQRFDCVVIGGGIGGMCAAALMASRGYRVFVAEKRPHLGGRFSTLDINGFKCPTGAALVMRGSELEKTFTATGAKFDIVKCSGVNWQIGDRIYAVSGKGVGKTILALITKLPRRYYKFAFMSILKIIKAGAELLILKFLNLFRSPDNELQPKHRENAPTFREWMMKYTDDPALIHASHVMISAMFSAVNDFECPADDVFRFAASMANPLKPHKFGYARNGNIDLINSLAKVVTDNGGEVKTGIEATGIKVENGIAKSVNFKNGKANIEIESDIVISNIGPRETMNLAGEKNYSERYRSDLKERVKPAPIVMGLIESDVPLIDRKGILIPDGTETIVGAVDLTLHSKNLSPEGKHLIWTFATPSTCTGNMDKDTEIRHNEEDLLKMFPLFKEHGKVLKWVPKDIDDDLPCMRSWPGYDMPVTTPVPNLFNVGDGVKDLGWTGSPACAKSAWKAAGIITKRYPPLKHPVNTDLKSPELRVQMT